MSAVPRMMSVDPVPITPPDVATSHLLRASDATRIPGACGPLAGGPDPVHDSLAVSRSLQVGPDCATLFRMTLAQGAPAISLAAAAAGSKLGCPACCDSRSLQPTIDMHRSMRVITCVEAVLALGAWPATVLAQSDGSAAVIGRWDLTVTDARGRYPSWLEVTLSGNSTLVGRFVGRVGSARPISRIDASGGAIRFAIPPQWDRDTADLRFDGHLAADHLEGTITNPDGSATTFTGTRAPPLIRTTPQWGEPIALFDGRTLAGWKTEPGSGQWSVANGVLTNGKSGVNLVSERTFTDFKLHVEFRYAKGGNSGVYLRGRYEVQIEDSPRRAIPLPVDIGAIYGFLPPNENAALGPGAWQAYDITLVGRRVTVLLNGRTIIADQLIPGPTGGAIDSDEAAPGPILLQGDHTVIEYRAVRITPAR
jgi:3-keto-disaccharide hydrolase